MRLFPIWVLAFGLLAQTLARQPDPTRVSRGFQSGESLAPAADPSTVRPFVPEWGAILPDSEGFKVARPCSRRAPERIDDVWVPDRAMVERVDRELAPIVQGALERSPFTRKLTWSSASYHRQYVGIVVGGRRIVYVNGFRLPASTEPQPPWERELVNACDGGELFFGAEFDVQSGRVRSLSFNSPL